MKLHNCKSETLNDLASARPFLALLRKCREFWKKNWEKTSWMCKDNS